MAGILEFLSSGVFHKTLHVDENSVRWQNGLVSKLHKATGSMLFLFSCTVFVKELLADHIHCMSKFSDDDDRKAFNSYCYIRSTFTITQDRDMNAGKYEYSHPGVESGLHDESQKTYHAYYQWVPYLFFLQALSFYLPHMLYKFSMDGRISQLTNNLQNVVHYNEDREDKIGDIHLYLQDTYGSRSWWATKLVASEFLNFINIILNIVVMDWYLGNGFLSYGPEVLGHQREEDGGGSLEQINPFDLVFPKMAKCTLSRFGPSGTIETVDGLCVLPINVLNEKLFLILWLVLVPLSILTVIDQLWWAMVIAFKPLRNKILVRHVQSSSMEKRKNLMRIARKVAFGDWMVLYLMAKNLDPAVFTDLAGSIHEPGAGYYPQEEEEHPM